MYDIKRVVCRECDESIGAEQVAQGKDLTCFVCEDRGDESKRLRMEFEVSWEEEPSEELIRKMADAAAGVPAGEQYRRYDQTRRYPRR